MELQIRSQVSSSFSSIILISKQAYKLELPKKWRIYNVFHISLLEQDITKKGQMNDTQLNFELEANNNEEYKVKSIWDSAVYASPSATEQLLRLYYLVLWKDYLEKENIWEPTLAIQHFWKLTTIYYKDNPEKLTAISPPVDTALPMTKPTIKLTAALTKKCGRLAKSTTTTTKQVKKF